ncbi:MAG: right-handed parallel beta-helix repeat-containing protein [Pseudomonadota bacterium]
MRTFSATFQVSIAIALLSLSYDLSATDYFIDSSSGNDNNDGTSATRALRSVSAANSLALRDGDRVLFATGQSFSGSLSIDVSASSASPLVVASFGNGARPILEQVTLGGSFVVIEDLIVDQRKGASDALRLRNCTSCTVRRIEVRNGTRDGIDANGSDSLLIEDVEIHHLLKGAFGGEEDAHGIVTTDCNGVTIRRANIHHVSGDSFQADPARVPGRVTDNILIEDSTLWTGPLSSDFNSGWRAGQSPGENAVDTKVARDNIDSAPRVSLIIRNVTAYGWDRSSGVSNRAAFNLKEKIEAVVDRVTVYDSEIAFRVRGTFGNANTRIANAVIYDVDTAVRAEDDLQNLTVFNSTFGQGIDRLLQVAGGDAGISSWDWQNNAAIDGFPSSVEGPTNVTASSSDFRNTHDDDYELIASSRLVNQGTTLPSVTVDRLGRQRSAPYDIGAYELNGAAPKQPNPPILRVD